MIGGGGSGSLPVVAGGGGGSCLTVEGGGEGWFVLEGGGGGLSVEGTATGEISGRSRETAKPRAGLI